MGVEVAIRALAHAPRDVHVQGQGRELERGRGGGGGGLLVRVEDSGEGFDVERALNAGGGSWNGGGRGLRLIRELSDR
ncbi:ATP-binding protein, partial [Pseudomonas aeruginosa]|uniref:ATP-binding protein n=1 Tax=Pseudomonas aeruginosa TaxID=287 RepID=UPI0028F4185A